MCSSDAGLLVVTFLVPATFEALANLAGYITLPFRSKLAIGAYGLGSAVVLKFGWGPTHHETCYLEMTGKD